MMLFLERQRDDDVVSGETEQGDRESCCFFRSLNPYSQLTC